MVFSYLKIKTGNIKKSSKYSKFAIIFDTISIQVFIKPVKETLWKC